MVLNFVVFAREVVKATLVTCLPRSVSEATLLIFILYFFSFVFSPIQGGVSDMSCRKRSMMLGFAATVGGLLFILTGMVNGKFALAFVGVSACGIWGNIIPIARAALVDVNALKLRRRLLSYTFIAQGAAWIVVSALLLWFGVVEVVISAILTCLFALCCVLIFFKDSRDLDPHATYSVKKEFWDIFKISISPLFLTFFLSFAFSETAFEIIYYAQEEVLSSSYDSFFVSSSFILGFVVGVIFQLIFDSNLKKSLLVGVFISVLSPIIWIFRNKSGLFQGDGFDFFDYSGLSFGSGVYLPALFSLGSENHQTHEQGKVFGLLDALPALGDLLAGFLILRMKGAGFLSLEEISAILFSVGLLILLARYRLIPKT